MPEQAPGYVFGAFIFTYGTGVLGQSREFLLFAVIVSTVIAFLWVTCAGHLSDVIGRKRMYMTGCVIMGIFGFVYFAMLGTLIPTVIFIAIAISGVPVMTLYGPEAALIAESSRHAFDTVARRLAISLPRSLPVARRRSSRRPCSPGFIQVCRSRFIS